MRIRWEDIPPEGLGISLEEMETPQLQAPKGTLEEGLRLASPLEGEIFLKRIPQGIKVKGKVKTSLFISCARCLKEFILPISSDFEELFLHIRYAPAGEEVELSREDMEVSFLREEVIDLKEVVEEQIWLQIPMKPLCHEGCKGLCPLCGADLNEGECGCDREIVDPRFALLKEIKLSLKR